MATNKKVLTGVAALLLLGVPVYQQTRIHSLEVELAAQAAVPRTPAKLPGVAAPVEASVPSSQREPARVASSPAPENQSTATPARDSQRTTRSGRSGDPGRRSGGDSAGPGGTGGGELTDSNPISRLGIDLGGQNSRTTNGHLHWDHAQATGAPDTPEAGDRPTAWAPRNPRSGEQWLQLGFKKTVPVKEINIHESHSSGAISKVTAFLPNGTEKTIWAGNAAAGAANEILETAIPVPDGITSSQIKVYVDTNRVGSWPEIDAVELVGTDGTRQWASQSSASSSYSEIYSNQAGTQSTADYESTARNPLTRGASLPGQ